MYKGTILQYLRKYIKDLQAEQLESYILSGECTLHSFELEPRAISDWVSDIFPYTAEVESVFCSKANIKIPWAQIRTKPLVIAVQEMEMVVHVHDFREQEWNMHMAGLQKNAIIANKISELNEIQNVPNFTKFLKQFELGWTDYVSGGMQIRVEFCRFILKSKSPSRIPRLSDGNLAPAFIVLIEGLFVAPCHDDGSLSYVESPDRVYQYIESKGLLRLSRLITLKSLQVSTVDHTTILTHSPGFRFRFSSEFTCVKLAKHKYSVPPFASASDSELWIDKVFINQTPHAACFYALLQDLAAPVIVPQEALSQANRFVHYAYREEEILQAKSEPELQSLLEPQPPVESIVPNISPVIIVEHKRAVTAPSDHNISLKGLFQGLAREVNKVSQTAHHKTDAIVHQGKKFLSAIKGKKKAPKRSTVDRMEVNASPPELDASANCVAEPSDVSVDVAESKQLDAVEIDMSEIGSSSGSFLDAIEKPDSPAHRVASVYHSEEEGQAVASGSAEGFVVTTDSMVGKLCFQSAFHFHVNEFLMADEPEFRVNVSQLDFRSTNETPLAFSQLCTLAGFCSDPADFVSQAKRLTVKVVCPLDPVSAHSALSFAKILVDKAGTNIVEFGDVSLAWKPQTCVRSSVLPVDGTLNRVVAFAHSWEVLSAYCGKFSDAAGSNPGSELAPEMQLNLIFSDLRVSGQSLHFCVPKGRIGRTVWDFVVAEPPRVTATKELILVPISEYTALVAAKLETVEQEVAIDSLRDQVGNLLEEITRKNVLLFDTEDSNENILTEKVCALETCLKEISREQIRVERGAEELRRTCADELVNSRAELLRETQRLEQQIDELKLSSEKTHAINAQQAEEIETLKRERDFLLALA